MTIAAILQAKGSEVLTVDGDTPVRDAVALLAERKIGAVPVLDGGRGRRHHVGARHHLLPEERRRRGARLAGRADHDRAGDHGRRPTTEIMSALSLMTRRRIRHLPVVEGEALIGLVSIGDLVKYRMDKIEAEAAAMLSYIQSV